MGEDEQRAGLRDGAENAPWDSGILKLRGRDPRTSEASRPSASAGEPAPDCGTPPCLPLRQVPKPRMRKCHRYKEFMSSQEIFPKYILRANASLFFQ